MKKVACFSIIAVMAIALIAPAAYALDLGTNITIPDLVYSGSGWTSNREDQEVEPRCSTGQAWDLEGMFLKGSTLSLVGGYDFMNGYQGQTPGDIFIDVDGDIKYGPAADRTGSNTSILKNTLGYDYVVHFDYDLLSYTVLSLDPEANLRSVYYAQNQESNAWLYVDGGVALDGYTGLQFGYLTGLTDGDVGMLGGSHNVLSVDLGFLGAGADFTAHYTMRCGNDNLMGAGSTPVPEPASIFLFGFGLVGLSAIRRKK